MHILTIKNEYRLIFLSAIKLLSIFRSQCHFKGTFDAAGGILMEVGQQKSRDIKEDVPLRFQ